MKLGVLVPLKLLWPHHIVVIVRLAWAARVLMIVALACLIEVFVSFLDSKENLTALISQLEPF